MIKKIAIRAGHNYQATGANGLINEVVEDRKVKDSVIKYLKQLGYEVIDVTPGNCDVDTDLEYGVNKAETIQADLFVSIHFDKAYDSYNGALGHACWISATGGNAEEIAQRVVNSVVTGTGFKNRGVRVNPHLYELRKTSMPSIIIETCFVEATEDVRIYKEKGFDLIGKLIAEGISNKLVPEVTPVLTPKKYAIVTANVLNVRKGAGLNAPIIGQVKKDDKIELDCKVGDWWSTYYGEHGGFMSAQYLKEI